MQLLNDQEFVDTAKSHVLPSMLNLRKSRPKAGKWIKVLWPAQEQVIGALLGVLIVTLDTVDASVAPRQVSPLAPAVQVRDWIVPVVAPAAQVMAEMPSADGTPPTPLTIKDAHSLALPIASPIAAPPAAALRACRN